MNVYILIKEMRKDGWGKGRRMKKAYFTPITQLLDATPDFHASCLRLRQKAAIVILLESG